MRPHRAPLSVFAALAFTLLVPAVGYVYLGALVASIFLIGYGSGFLLWWCCPTDAPFAPIRAPYWLTLAAFALHKAEENRAEFFETLSREITGIPVPETTLLLFLLLLVIPAGAWLLVPWLMNRRNPLGGLSGLHVLRLDGGQRTCPLRVSSADPARLRLFPGHGHGARPRAVRGMGSVPLVDLSASAASRVALSVL